MRQARAQGIAEYALIILFIVIIAAIGIAFLGNSLGELLNSIGQAFKNCAVTKLGVKPKGC